MLDSESEEPVEGIERKSMIQTAVSKIRNSPPNVTTMSIISSILGQTPVLKGLRSLDKLLFLESNTSDYGEGDVNYAANGRQKPTLQDCVA